MRTNTIIDTPEYRIVSHGNGLAYQFINKEIDQEVFFQGDDALAFENEFNEDRRDLEDIWIDYCELAEPYRPQGFEADHRRG